MFRYCLYRIGRCIVNLLPLRAAYFLAERLADAHYLLSIADRRAVQSNLRNILGPLVDVSALSREVFRNFARYLVEFFAMKRLMNDAYLGAHVEIENDKPLKEAVMRGCGAIILSAHLGNWELGGAILSRMGFPLTVVALPHNHRRINDFFNSQREFFGNRVVSPRSAVRECTKALKDNRMIALIADRDFSGTGVMMPFFGHPMHLPIGAALFSLRQGAPIIPTFFMRRGRDNFTLSFLEPIYPERVADCASEDEKIQRLMGIYVRIFEEKIRAMPEQWLMFRDFTKA
jgi:KDO2-lipid IV(A) lauroyltransferase